MDNKNNDFKYEDNGFHGDQDGVYSLENGSATVIWIIVMILGSIFTDRVWIWIIATVIWFNHITRHWNVGGKK